MKNPPMLAWLFLVALPVVAQEADTVTSDAIIDGLLGTEVSRAIVARQRPDPAGMSIDLSVEFELNSAELTEQARRQLDELGRALANPRVRPYRFEIVGHTDARGDDDYNERLSLARAARVREYLQDAGIERDRLLIDGRGESELLYPHLPEDGRNRRVEITNLGASTGSE